MTKQQLLKILYAFQIDLADQFFRGGEAPIGRAFTINGGGETSYYADSRELTSAINEAFEEDSIVGKA